MPFDDPIGRLEDILDAVTRIQRYAGGLSLAAFEADEKTVDAVVRNYHRWRSSQSCFARVDGTLPEFSKLSTLRMVQLGVTVSTAGAMS